VLTGLPASVASPLIDGRELPETTHLDEGSLGFIALYGHGITHTIGYGMGDEGLEVLPTNSEFGFARNEDVRQHYRELNPGILVTMHQCDPALAASRRLWLPYSFGPSQDG